MQDNVSTSSDIKRQGTSITQSNGMLAGVVLLGGIAGLSLKIFYPQLLTGAILPYWLKAAVVWPLLKFLKETLTNPFTYIAMAGILWVERLIPAKPEQKTFNVGLAQDSVWVILEILFQANVVFVVVHLLKSFYNHHLSFLTIEAIGELPLWVRFIWGILLGDFLGWFHHWVRHKVPWFWYFHTIHHSQKQLNMFTDMRYHVVEYIISNCIKIFPLMMLSVGTPQIVYYTLFNTWYTRAYHGNIKSHYGIFRHILVTPQSHRIHHSNQRQHRDKNFGVLFCIWDRLFGTHYYGYEEYPDTGIDDETFPHETTVKGFSLILTPLAQLLYPFQAIFRSLRRKKKS